ncbi:hypothetical protein ES707_11010 [subsurface metagenome]
MIKAEFIEKWKPQEDNFDEHCHFNSDLNELCEEVAKEAFEAGYKADRNLRLNPFDEIAKVYCDKKFKIWEISNH